MRFKKGSKVEVLSKEAPSGSWLCAKVISGNGHYYNVKYDRPSGTATIEGIVERVSRKVIRPCPPVVYVENWIVNDVVEAFDDYSWRTVVVSKVLRGDFYLVRLLGSSRDFEVYKFNTRVRHLWQDDNWFVIGKGSRSCDVKLKKLSTLNCYQRRSQAIPANSKRKFQEEDDRLTVQSKIGLQESLIWSSNTRNRASPYCSSHVDTCSANVQKMRAIEKEGRRQRLALSPLLQKVDAVAYPQDNMGEKYMHDSFNKQTTEYHEMETGKPNGLVKCVLARSSELNDFDSDVCSVGSCSVISDRINELPSHMLPGHSHDIDTSYSDAESFCDWRDEEEECPLPPKEDVAAKIHRLELHAYRRTLEAFYASGPLSWKLEALLTNLRILLHISNDEHLMELKTLVSTGTSPLIS